MRFQSNIVESSNVSPLFTRVKIHVAYEGENRNGSFISRDTFEKAASLATYCPIIGEWSENDQDFQGHGGKIEIKDDEVKYIRTTMPYGCIGTEPPTWETVIDDNGNEKEYFTLIGYIWSSRYPELNSIIEDGFRFHSMEVEINSGNFQDINGKKLYVIDDMLFSGFCILGNSVEPCFQDSTISTYSVDKKELETYYKQMLTELRYTLQKELSQSVPEGGKEMEEIKEELVMEEKQFDAQSSEDDEVEVIVDVEDNDDPQDEDQEDVATDNQEEMAMKSDSEPDGDEDGKDTDDDGDGKFELLETEIASLKEKYSLLENEVVELRVFKAQKLHEEKSEQIDALFESVSGELTEEEIIPFKEKAFEMEIEELKKELFALIGQKEFEKKSKFSVNSNKPMTMGIELNEDTKISNSYDAIIKKYINK